MRNFFFVAIPLYLFSTSIFAFFTYCLYLCFTLVTFTKTDGGAPGKLPFKLKLKTYFKPYEIAASIAIILSMVAFYALRGKTEGASLFFSNRFSTFGIKKFVLFYLQELTPFVVAAVVFKINTTMNIEIPTASLRYVFPAIFDTPFAPFGALRFLWGR